MTNKNKPGLFRTEGGFADTFVNKNVKNPKTRWEQLNWIARGIIIAIMMICFGAFLMMMAGLLFIINVLI